MLEKHSSTCYHYYMMIDDNTRERINSILPLLNENQKRKYLAAESKSPGWGGAGAVSDFTGVTGKTIRLGMKELEFGETDSPVLPGDEAVSNLGKPDTQVGCRAQGHRNRPARHFSKLQEKGKHWELQE